MEKSVRCGVLVVSCDFWAVCNVHRGGGKKNQGDIKFTNEVVKQLLCPKER